jgi:thioredoxin-related protein
MITPAFNVIKDKYPNHIFQSFDENDGEIFDEISLKYDVRTVPTFLFIDEKTNEVVGKIVGAVPEAQFTKLVEGYLNEETK